MRHSLSSYHDNYIAWMRRSLEIWAVRGRDSHGGWYEHLKKDGTADHQAIRRHRVQARQTFSYAAAHMFGWADGKDIAISTFQFMCLQGWQGEHFIHRMDADYLITDELCDLYDHAFYLLASASMYKLTGEAVYAKWIEKIIASIDRLRSPKGGWEEGNTSALPRRQNPHMHLFEVYLYLYESTKEPQYLNRAQEVLALFKAHFYDPSYPGIIEFFDDDWTRASGDKGRVLEPGHAAEWIWLLGWYDRLTGDDHSIIRLRLFDNLSRQSGPYLIDETCAPDNAPVRATRRLWVETEWIKAHLTLIEDGYTPAEEMLPDLLDHFMTDYLTPEGLWEDQYDQKGKAIAKTIPVSTMYHIIGMVSELERLVKS